MKNLNFLGLLMLYLYSQQVHGSNIENEKRDGKLLSLFSVVQFKNEGCTTTLQSTSNTNTNKQGTCYTSSECSDLGGSAEGNCAAGFGVCCYFRRDSAGELNQNCTYIQNPGFPSKYSETNALTYTIKKCSDEVCSVRLDFESFQIYGLADTNEMTGGACTNDKLTMTGTTGSSLPVICGQNDGQHVYIDMGTGSSGTAQLSFEFANTFSDRGFEIKATQIKCNDKNSAPSNCLQYHTGTSGRIQTFNWPATGTTAGTAEGHLQNQNYDVCIRQEDGFCCVEYTACAGETNAWSIDSINDMKAYNDTPFKDKSCCGKADATHSCRDYVRIDGGSTQCSTSQASVSANLFCGDFLNIYTDTAGAGNAQICDCSAPFSVGIYTNAASDMKAIGESVDSTAANAAISKGVCLDYRQIPC